MNMETELRRYKGKESELVGKMIARLNRGKIRHTGTVISANKSFVMVEFVGVNGPFKEKIAYSGRAFGSGEWSDYYRLTTQEEVNEQAERVRKEDEIKSLKNEIRNALLGDFPLEKLKQIKEILKSE